MNIDEIIINNIEKLRKPTEEYFVGMFNTLKNYGVNPSEEMMKELAQKLWKSVETSFKQGITTCADIIENKLGVK